MVLIEFGFGESVFNEQNWILRQKYVKISVIHKNISKKIYFFPWKIDIRRLFCLIFAFMVDIYPFFLNIPYFTNTDYINLLV